MAPTADIFAAATAHAESSEAWFRERLRTLVEHRTVSPGGGHRDEIVAGAKAARDLMQAEGASAELVECSGTPAILARFGHPQPRRRVVVYNHFDVQPADASEGWTQTNPFAFEVHPDARLGFRYCGRGTTDDKGPALCALRAAAFIAEHKLPIEIVCLWETEEEIGSPHFSEIVRSRRDVLRGDGVVISDTIWPGGGQPAISLGLRGMVHATLRLRTGDKDVHSGLTGGVARNPVRELCRLASAIQDAAFWHRDVADVSDEEISGFLRSGFDPEHFKRAHGLHSVESTLPVDMLLRLWAKPTFEIHGLSGGYHGAGVKTIVPHEAELKISFRLVPDQNPARLTQDLQDFVRVVAPDVMVEAGGQLAPYRGHASGPIHDAIVTAMHDTFGRDPVLVREGGSIGAVSVLARELDVPVHFLPLSLPEHGYHAPNEYFDWKQARGGIEAFARLFALLASA